MIKTMNGQLQTLSLFVVIRHAMGNILAHLDLFIIYSKLAWSGGLERSRAE